MSSHSVPPGPHHHVITPENSRPPHIPREDPRMLTISPEHGVKSENRTIAFFLLRCPTFCGTRVLLRSACASVQFLGGGAEEGAFQASRAALASPTVLAFPDPNKPFGLHTDASVVGAGAVLMQEVGGVPRVISFASHRFSRTDARVRSLETRRRDKRVRSEGVLRGGPQPKAFTGLR